MGYSVNRLERKLEMQDFKLNALLEVTRAINDNVPETSLLEQYRQSLAENLGVDRLALFVAADDGATASFDNVLVVGVDQILPPRLHRPPSDEPSNRVAVPAAGGREELFDVAIPVEHEGHTTAWLFAGDSEEGRGVSPVVKHLNFIQTLTNVLVVAMMNRRLRDARLQQEATRRELELAADMQALLVPVDWPEDPDLEIAAYYKPHTEVGGDYFDVFNIDENRVVLCMADVSGKGISAAFLMSNFQANLRAIFTYEPDDLEAAVRQLNGRVMDIARGEKYITMFAAVIHRKTRQMSYVTCGHNPPMLMTASGEATLLTLGSVGLGMFNEIPTVQCGQAQVTPESLLICFTDGLVEQENVEGIPFGMSRLEAIVKARRGMPIADIQRSLLEELETFRGEEPTFDDTAVLSLRFR